MKKALRLLLLFLFFFMNTPLLRAQLDAVSVSFGAGSYKMEDMKYIQEYILGTYPVEGKITSSFPPFTSFSLAAYRQMDMKRLRLSINYAHSITGGKSSYYDYTGYIITQIDAGSHRLGVGAYYSLLEGAGFDISAFALLEGNLSTIVIESSIYAMGSSNGGMSTYRALQASATGGLTLMYRIRDISLGIEGAYLKDIPRVLKEKENKTELTDPNDVSRGLVSDWSGWQAKVRVVFWIKKSEL